MQRALVCLCLKIETVRKQQRSNISSWHTAYKFLGWYTKTQRAAVADRLKVSQRHAQHTHSTLSRNAAALAP